MYSIVTIVDEILRQAKALGLSITPMKLMKLAYIAHRWHLAIKDQPLFNERIEAWKYGPVMPSLYSDTKQFGRNPIPLDLIDDEPINPVETSTKKFIADVMERYANYSAFDLSDFTHEKGTPWEKVYSDQNWGASIPNGLIQEHYKEKLRNG